VFGYEIARRLRQGGETVAMLALIDPLAMDRATKWRYGYWAMEARFMRRPLRWLVLLAGWLRVALPDRFLEWESADSTDDTTRSQAQFLLSKEEARTNPGFLRQLSVLLELNTGLPFALTESELSRVEADRYLDVLLERVKTITPDVDAGTIENIAIQYEMQVRSQHAYRLRPYDGRLVLFEPDGPHRGLLAAQIRPYVKELCWQALKLGPPSDRTRALAEMFPERIRSHYLCMRDDAFVASLADELGKLLS
jgi:thioesterase domain-containing protein